MKARTRRTLVWGSVVASCLVAASMAAAQTVKEEPKVQAKPGLYFESKGDAGKVDLVRLEGTPPARVGGGGMAVPFKKPKFTTMLSGDRASRRLLTMEPAFVFVLGALTREQMMEDPMRVMDTPPPTASNAKEFVLAPLSVADGGRSVQSGSGGVKVTIESLGGKTFRVRPESPLPPGEYGFYFAGKGNGMGSSIIWDFGVDPPK